MRTSPTVPGRTRLFGIDCVSAASIGCRSSTTRSESIWPAVRIQPAGGAATSRCVLLPSRCGGWGFIRISRPLGCALVHCQRGGTSPRSVPGVGPVTGSMRRDTGGQRSATSTWRVVPSSRRTAVCQEYLAWLGSASSGAASVCRMTGRWLRCRVVRCRCSRRWEVGGFPLARGKGHDSAYMEALEGLRW